VSMVVASMASVRMRKHLQRRASHTACVSNACCFAPGYAGINVVVVEREAWEDVDVREVVVPCERI